MTDQERVDHWASLASELGAASPPEEKEQEEQPSAEMTGDEEPSPPTCEGPRYSFSRPETQRTPSDWLRLAEQLGVVADSEVISEPPLEATRTEVVEAQIPASVPSEPPAVVMEAAETDVNVIDVVEVSDEGDGQLCDQLVGRVDTDAIEEERSDKKRRRRRRRRRPRSAEEGQAATESSEVSLEEEVGVGEQDEESEGVVGSSESLIVSPLSPISEEAPSRGKRRRRRRSSGKKKEETRTVEAAVNESLMSVTGEAALVPLDESDAELSHAVIGDESGHGDGIDEDGDERPVHRGIPTWDEAVGIVITRNMEARAKAPSGQQRSRGNRNRN